MGYGLLSVLYPEEVFDLAPRIDGALAAYACGDALGVPWASPPDANAHPTASQIEQLPAREGWPRGATSDDTALTLLVAHHLADRDGQGDRPPSWRTWPSKNRPSEASARPPQQRSSDSAAAVSLPTQPRATYGGPGMRALPIGWAIPHDQAERRRQLTIAMSQATHAEPVALVAAARSQRAHRGRWRAPASPCCWRPPPRKP